MRRFMLRAKVHGASVTQVDLAYEGSLTLDEKLMKEAGMAPYEQIQVYNITNGERFTTYLIKGEEGSGIVCVNGAAAHKAVVGDKVIIAAYSLLEDEELEYFVPAIVIVDDKNRIKQVK
jgi:aspartate 1-decarboxylase